MVVTGPPAAFRITYTFDVSQTDGEELPEPPVSSLQGDDPDELYTRLLGVAASIGYTVEEDYLEGHLSDGESGRPLARIWHDHCTQLGR